MDRPSDSTSLDEQRASERQDVHSVVSLRLDEGPLEGESENVSGAGILFSVEEPLRVTVRYDRPDGEVERSGHLVRLQRMSDGRTGVAVEFDD